MCVRNANNSCWVACGSGLSGSLVKRTCNGQARAAAMPFLGIVSAKEPIETNLMGSKLRQIRAGRCMMVYSHFNVLSFQASLFFYLLSRAMQWTLSLHPDFHNRHLQVDPLGMTEGLALYPHSIILNECKKRLSSCNDKSKNP
jgi:hypothetical protein